MATTTKPGPFSSTWRSMIANSPLLAMIGSPNCGARPGTISTIKPKRLTPVAHLVWLSSKITTDRGIDIDDAEPLINDAAMILWPEITAHELADAWVQAANQRVREARTMHDQLAEMMLRSGGKTDVLIRDVADGGPLDPEPRLREMYPDPPPAAE